VWFGFYFLTKICICERVKLNWLIDWQYDSNTKRHILFDVQFENVSDSEREVSLSEVSVS